MPIYKDVQLTRVFQGLANPTRRAVIARLSVGPAAVSELARSSRMALPSFLQHLQVLENCGLVRSHKSGRVRTYRLTQRPLLLAESWLERRRAHWNRRLDQLDSYLISLKDRT